MSHYPKSISPNAAIRNDLNRQFVPYELNIEHAPAHVLWCYVNRTSGPANHFVPLLPMVHRCIDQTEDEVDVPAGGAGEKRRDNDGQTEDEDLNSDV